MATTCNGAAGMQIVVVEIQLQCVLRASNLRRPSTCTCKTQSRDPKSKVLKTGDCPAARGTKGTMSEAEGLSKGIAGSSECLNLFGVGLGFEGLG